MGVFVAVVVALGTGDLECVGGTVAVLDDVGVVQAVSRIASNATSSAFFMICRLFI